MYLCAEIIYGIPLTKKIEKVMDNLEDDKWFESDDYEDCCGFDIFYHGDWDGRSGFCGVILDSFTSLEIIDLKKLKIKPTKKQIKKAEKRIAELFPEIKAIAPKTGVYIVWSSS